MKLFIIAALLAVAAAAPSSYTTKAPEITIVSHDDVRNLDGSSKFNYAGSDGTTRGEYQAQKQLTDAETKETVSGNTNKGEVYYISPEGQKITLSWVADENGFQPQGDHLPVAPVYDGVPPVFDGVAPVAPALPYSRTGLGY